MKYKPLGMYLKQTDELKKLIEEHPDYPIVVLVVSDVVCDDYCAWYYAPDLRFKIGEILDCEQDINDEKIYYSRDDFEEDISYMLEDEFAELSEEEFDKKVQEVMKEYEPYWKNVIEILADV